MRCLASALHLVVAATLVGSCGGTPQSASVAAAASEDLVFPHDDPTSLPGPVVMDPAPRVEVAPPLTDLPEATLKIKRGAEITGIAHRELLRMIRPAIYERDIKTVIRETYAAQGADGEAFSSIVGSGPNSLELHYSGSSRQLRDGDLVVVDIGAKFQGFCSDITRTYPASGTYSARQREVYALVLAARDAAAEAMRPGVTTLGEMTNWVKTFMRQSPLRAKDRYGRLRTMDTFFIHGLGHYLGRQVHEPGDLYRPVPIGQAFTIEPGIYIESEGFGIRIEDDYVMTPEGAEILVADTPVTPEEIEALMAAEESP